MGQGALRGRLDGAVPAGHLGVGETVEVRTRMGAAVMRGDVRGVNPFGAIVCDEAGQHRFFAEQFYLFMPEEPEAPTVAANLLADRHPDARVAAKLGLVAEQGATPEAPGNTAQPIDDEEEAPAEEPSAAQQRAAADDASSVDVAKLPDDIRQAVVTVQKIDGDQLNYVLAQVGQAMTSALRRSGVSEAQLHGLVQRAQNAVYRVMTGKPARQWRQVAQGE